MSDIKYSIIIPCYNEVDNVEHLISRIITLQKNYSLEYILVENGSIDSSRRYFKKNVEGKYKDITVVYVEKNKGYGYGIQCGIKASKGKYIGWIHADLQISPSELIKFFEYELQHENDKIFFKGVRKNRSIFDKIFTNGQAVLNTILFRNRLYDIGGIPVLYEKSLINNIDDLPNDFSIELYVYNEACNKKFKIKRFEVILEKRDKGKSSWDKGIMSKIKQSKRIFDDSIKIWKGEKVL